MKTTNGVHGSVEEVLAKWNPNGTPVHELNDGLVTHGHAHEQVGNGNGTD